MACDPLFDDGFVFPRRAANRPALPRIGYRIGRFDDFLEAMLRRVNASVPLGAWTHREPDDPAIAYCQDTPLRSEIEARDASRLRDATEKAAEALASRFGSRHIEGRIRAFVITAIR